MKHLGWLAILFAAPLAAQNPVTIQPGQSVTVTAAKVKPDTVTLPAPPAVHDTLYCAGTPWACSPTKPVPPKDTLPTPPKDTLPTPPKDSVPTPPVGTACLSQTGPLVTLTGTQAKIYDHRADLAANTKINATAATWTGKLAYGAYVGTGTNLCWSGGKFVGQWPASTVWDTYHSTGAMLINSPHAIVEDVTIAGYGDGIRLETAPHWTLRRVHISDSHDDCIENDPQYAGLIDDVLLEGCFVFLSERPGNVVNPNPGADTVTVQNSLVWQKPVAFPEGCRIASATPPCSGPLWKWAGNGTKVVITNTIFRVDQKPSNGNLNLPPNVVRCEGNTMVWLGAGKYPGTLPACFTVTTDKTVWEKAAAAWKAKHPVTR